VADLTIQRLSQTGVTPTFSSAASLGDTFTNDGNTWLHVKNGGASSVTVTIDSKAPCNQGFDHDLAVTIAAGGEKVIGRFEQSRFNDTTGKVSVAYTAVTTVTVAAIGL
jgi:hypothetical protein